MIETFRTTAYIMKTDALSDPSLFSSLISGLPEEDNEKVNRYRRQDSRIQTAAARLLLRTALEDHGIPSGASIGYVSNGKPVLTDFPGVHFNLSHTHSLAVCVLSPRPCGCDAEKVKPGHLRLLKKLSPEERTLISSLPDDDSKDLLFTRIWTLRESYMKYTGLGFALPLSSFSIRFENGIPVPVSEDGPLAFLTELPLTEGCCVSLCTERKIKPVIKEVTLTGTGLKTGPAVKTDDTRDNP